MSDYDFLFKVLMTGKYNAGKTSLMERIRSNEFTQPYVCNIGVDFMVKKYECEGKRIKVQFWDTAGVERFRNIQLSSCYYRGSKGIFIVFDLNDPESFNDIEHWFEVIRRNYNQPPIMFLIGSKSDLNQRVSERIILKLSKKFGNLPMYYCSSLNGSGINKMERDLIIEMLKKEPNDARIEIGEKEEVKHETKERNWYCYLV